MPTQARRSTARRRVLIAALTLLVVMLALAAAWHWTPLAEFAEPRHVARWLRGTAHSVWMPPIIATIYVAASWTMFPNTVLCLAVILALGPVEGAAYAYGGSMTAALVGYTLGRRGGAIVDKLNFRRFDKISAQLRRGGFVQVLMLRMLPIAPFTATNILSGAARVRVLPFAAATVIGISPYILTFAIFGRQARRLLTDPSGVDIAVTVAIVALASLIAWRARSAAAARAH